MGLVTVSRFLGWCLLSMFSVSAMCQQKVIKIYHDADYASHHASANAMYMGLSTALSEVDFQVQGYRIELLKKDHRGNSNRSKLHMQQFLRDEQALFMLGGLHSPPYIKFRDFINENGVLLLVPWAAGGPITRYEGEPNWVFRLSIDDTKAGYRIAEFAAKNMQCQRPHLLLEDTPWGHSNDRTMTAALTTEMNMQPDKTWFNWSTKDTRARILLRDILARNTDCILFVGNAIEGAVFSNALAELATSQVSFISHWGITGGDFAQRVSHKVRSKINLHFIQSCFSFVSSPATEFSNGVLQQAMTLFPDIRSAKDIKAPPGFIHSYDLGRLVIAALNQVQLQDDMVANRGALRAALENIEGPVQGLLKNYQFPFHAWSKAQDSAHEALGLEDFCMGNYLQDDSIALFNPVN